MTDVPFDRQHAPPIGCPEILDDGLRVVTAPNPGPMTFTGTRSYILGHGRVAIIDPGPALPVHLDALANVVTGETVEAILVTHAHRDHSEGAQLLGEMLGAPVLAHGDPRAARSELMERLAGSGLLGGGEGIDTDFMPDSRLRDGDIVSFGATGVRVLHTPGHLSDHLCFQWGSAVFTGDLAMGWASTMISPPDGDLGAFRSSIARLREVAPRRLFPGHGAPVDAPDRLLKHLLAHRENREAQILGALEDGPASIRHLVSRLYADVEPALHGAAGRNVLAHLIDLQERGMVSAPGGVSLEAIFERS